MLEILLTHRIAVKWTRIGILDTDYQTDYW